MKEFIYDQKSYIFDVIITGFVSLLASIIAVILILLNILPSLMCLILVTGLYSGFNCFVAKVHPQKITIVDHIIIMESFGVERKFDIGSVERFSIREFPSAGKMYIRISINNASMVRYWINSKCYNDSAELFKMLLELEYLKHPNTLKAKAREINTSYIERKRVKNEI